MRLARELSLAHKDKPKESFFFSSAQVSRRAPVRAGEAGRSVGHLLHLVGGGGGRSNVAAGAVDNNHNNNENRPPTRFWRASEILQLVVEMQIGLRLPLPAPANNYAVLAIAFRRAE